MKWTEINRSYEQPSSAVLQNKQRAPRMRGAAGEGRKTERDRQIDNASSPGSERYNKKFRFLSRVTRGDSHNT